MNRENLYQAIIKDEERREFFDGWFYGDLIHYANGDVYIRQSQTGSEEQVIPETVCQQINRKDKNGANLFECDYDAKGNIIVWCDKCMGWQFGQLDIPTNEVVISCHWCDGNFGFQDQINDFEKVGNIRDHFYLKSNVSD